MSIKLDKLWSYIKNKSKQKYLWYNIDHNTGYILAYTFKKERLCIFKTKEIIKTFKYRNELYRCLGKL